MKKALNLFLISFVIVMCFSVSVFAAETTYDLSVNGDNSVIATYDDTTYTLTISGTGATKDYKKRDIGFSQGSGTYPPYSDKLSKIQKVVVEEGITSLGNNLFSYYGGSSSYSGYLSKNVVVELPSTLKSIGEGVFQNAGITQINIPDSVTTIGYKAFDGCSYLTDAHLPSNLENIGAYAFYVCSALDGITIPNGTLTIGEGAFGHCSSLTSISIPTSVTSIGKSAFTNCNKLETVNILCSAAVIGKNVFSRCMNLKNVSLPNGLTTISSSMFYESSSLKTINIPDSVTSIDSLAFYNSGLTSVDLPDGLTTIGVQAFYGASSLSTIRNMSQENQTIGDGAFSSITPSPTVYQYRANTAMTTAATDYMTSPTIIYFDDIVLSGDLENGIHWVYDTDTQTLSFNGDGEIPDYTDGSQPWYAAASSNGGVGTYKFGDGITGIGNGIFSNYGFGTGGFSIYGPSGIDYAGAGGGGGSYVGTVDGSGGGSSSGEGGGSGGGSSSGEGGSGSGSTGSTGDAMIIVDATPTQFTVTVPIIVSVEMNSDGSVSVPGDYYVTNECALGPVVITEIKVTSATGWKLSEFDADYSNMKASTKTLGLSINDVPVGIDGSVVMNESLTSSILNRDKKALTFDAKLPAQRTRVNENVAAIVFTVDFDKV